MLGVWWPGIRRSGGLGRVIEPGRALGAEAFLFGNGSMIMLASGTEASDHGDTLDLAVIDEAWAQRDDSIEQAVKPAMMTRDDAQLWVVSTAGGGSPAALPREEGVGRAVGEVGAPVPGAYFRDSPPWAG